MFLRMYRTPSRNPTAAARCTACCCSGFCLLSLSPVAWSTNNDCTTKSWVGCQEVVILRIAREQELARLRVNLVEICKRDNAGYADEGAHLQVRVLSANMQHVAQLGIDVCATIKPSVDRSLQVRGVPCRPPSSYIVQDLHRFAVSRGLVRHVWLRKVCAALIEEHSGHVGCLCVCDDTGHGIARADRSGPHTHRLARGSTHSFSRSDMDPANCIKCINKHCMSAENAQATRSAAPVAESSGSWQASCFYTRT